ncbi:hypothetical protein Bca4012_056238 [Brassica carinata]
MRFFYFSKPDTQEVNDTAQAQPVATRDSKMGVKQRGIRLNLFLFWFADLNGHEELIAFSTMLKEVDKTKK